MDLSKFNLVYIRNTDERRFLCRAVTKDDYVLIDTTSGEVLRTTQSKLRRNFSPDKEMNQANKKNMFWMNYGKKRVL